MREVPARQETVAAPGRGERRWLEETASTNDVARAWAEAGASDGAVVWAERQTAGRGRRGRVWACAPGKGLYASFVLRPTGDAARAERAAELAVLGGMAAYGALRAAGMPGLRVKWPNDVLSNGRKVAGVLVEPVVAGGRVEFAVMGIGINVAQCAEDFPEELRGRATSCQMEGVETGVEEMLGRVEDALAEARQIPYDVLEAAWKAAGAVETEG